MEIGLLLVLGWVAGWLTTVAGLGGGVFLILALSLRMSPAAITQRLRVRS